MSIDERDGDIESEIDDETVSHLGEQCLYAGLELRDGGGIDAAGDQLADGGGLHRRDVQVARDGRDGPPARRIGRVAQIVDDQLELRIARRREHQPFEERGEGLHGGDIGGCGALGNPSGRQLR